MIRSLATAAIIGIIGGQLTLSVGCEQCQGQDDITRQVLATPQSDWRREIKKYPNVLNAAFVEAYTHRVTAVFGGPPPSESRLALEIARVLDRADLVQSLVHKQPSLVPMEPAIFLFAERDLEQGNLTTAFEAFTLHRIGR